jgi:hypothetical protein
MKPGRPDRGYAGPGGPTGDHDEAADSGEFSLVLGGPLYQLLLRTRLAARPPLDLLKRRIVAITLLAWLPLLVLSALEGRAFGDGGISFLEDLDAQVRLLVALPLLILAEKIVHERLRPAVTLFVEKGIVRPKDRPRFDGIVSSTMRWRNAVVVELGLLAFVFSGGHTIWAERLAVHGPTWFVGPADARLGLSRAGLWYVWISLPIVQFLLLRWWYRLILWCRLLFLVSRLDLDLSPSNPDRAGGLGYLGTSAAAFAPFLTAQSAIVSALVAGRILQHGAHLLDFKLELGGFLVFALLQALGPLMVFAPTLLEARRRGLRQYGVLADRYVKEFDRKWIHGGAAPDEPLVGSADIQSLADLANSFDVVQGMRPFPFGKETVIPLAVTVVLPGLPLVLTVIPLEELIKRLLGALL